MIAAPEMPNMRNAFATHAKNFPRLSPLRDFHHNFALDRLHGHFVAKSRLCERHWKLRNDIIPAPLERGGRPDMDIHEKVASRSAILSRRAATPHGERLPIVYASRNFKRRPFFLLQTPSTVALGAFFPVYLAPAMTALAGRHLGKRPENSLHRALYLASALAVSACLFWHSRLSARAMTDTAL